MLMRGIIPQGIMALAFLLACQCQGQRLLRSHLLQAHGGDTRCALVIRDADRFEDPEVIVFRYANAKRLWPGDYLVAYFVDTGYVNSEWMHVSHEKSLVDQWIVIGDIPVHRVKFGTQQGDTSSIVINVAP